MKLLISALLCLFLWSCSEVPPIDAPAPADVGELETAEAVTSASPGITLSYGDLNNYTFEFMAEGETFRIAGDNMKGKSSQLHISKSGYDAIFQLNTKGGSKLYFRSEPEEDYKESDIEYSDVDLNSLRATLYHVGVDFGDFYEGAVFTLESEDDQAYKYRMDFDGNTYRLTVDRDTGVWTELSCKGKTLMKVTEFSLEKGIIPNH